MTYTFKKDHDRAKISIQKKSECIILCVSRGITIEETSYIRLETLELMRKYFHFFFSYAWQFGRRIKDKHAQGVALGMRSR